MILDDGGDATLLVHKGVEFEKAGACPEPTERRGHPTSGGASCQTLRGPDAGPTSPTASRA
jgi:S-adenosylhomocysteine hydrolase